MLRLTGRWTEMDWTPLMKLINGRKIVYNDLCDTDASIQAYLVQNKAKIHKCVVFSKDFF